MTAKEISETTEALFENLATLGMRLTKRQGTEDIAVCAVQGQLAQARATCLLVAAVQDMSERLGEELPSAGRGV